MSTPVLILTVLFAVTLTYAVRTRYRLFLMQTVLAKAAKAMDALVEHNERVSAHLKVTMAALTAAAEDKVNEGMDG